MSLHKSNPLMQARTFIESWKSNATERIYGRQGGNQRCQYHVQDAELLPAEEWAVRRQSRHGFVYFANALHGVIRRCYALQRSLSVHHRCVHRVKSFVHVVDPESDIGSLERLFGIQGNFGKYLLQVLENDQRLRYGLPIVNQDWNLLVNRIEIQQKFRFAIQVHFITNERDALLPHGNFDSASEKADFRRQKPNGNLGRCLGL
ncbi:hypothetical protein Mapa_007067 [Marchantia paleacea]|nr:hypothetical protein Mapa_007067 [Marchantia paleacea]